MLQNAFLEQSYIARRIGDLAEFITPRYRHRQAAKSARTRCARGWWESTSGAAGHAAATAPGRTIGSMLYAALAASFTALLRLRRHQAMSGTEARRRAESSITIQLRQDAAASLPILGTRHTLRSVGVAI